MGALLTRAKVLTEPAGAAGVAALLSGCIPIETGDRVVAVLSGGNIAPADLQKFACTWED
jgi:threonine dehydratase